MIGTVLLLLFFSESWIKIPSWGSWWSWWKCHLQFLNPAAFPGGSRKIFLFSFIHAIRD
jgi:hypothetical protein